MNSTAHWDSTTSARSSPLLDYSWSSRGQLLIRYQLKNTSSSPRQCRSLSRKEEDDMRGGHAPRSLRGWKHLGAEKVDERETQESEGGLKMYWVLVKDSSERCPRCPLVNIEQEETLYPSFIQFHLDSPSTIHRDEKAVRPCLVRRGRPNVDIGGRTVK